MRANSKDVTFEVSNQGIIPVHIRTDEVRLKQILINVISNAIKFTEKGTVALAIRCLTDDVTREKKIEFIVRDTGVGISSTAKSGLFEAFNQGDVSTTRKFGGTGLGLALSRKIARALGGDLSLEYSEPGKGTVFKILIELDEVEGTEWADSWDGDKMNEFAKDYLQESLLRPLEAKNILLVEDSPDNQEIFQYFLTEAGANVKISKDGIEAVEEATRGNYDIVLMDIQLPRMDGKEATWRLRQQGFNKPIIALTAHAMIEEVKSCLMAGCNGQITKPVTRDSLISDVQYYLTY